MMELCRNPVGRTPWSARVPPDPLFVWNQLPAERERPARGPAADQGVRPTCTSRILIGPCYGFRHFFGWLQHRPILGADGAFCRNPAECRDAEQVTAGEHLA